MVYFEDLGTVLDLPLEEMESFLGSAEHSSAHSDDVRNFEVVETNGPTIVLAYERKLDGTWGKSRTRMTTFPPYGAFVEEIEGVFAGSRFVVVHRPEGAKTRVDVFGEAHCKTKSPEELRSYWLDMLAKAHDEDVATLQRLRDRT